MLGLVTPERKNFRSWVGGWVVGGGFGSGVEIVYGRWVRMSGVLEKYVVLQEVRSTEQRVSLKK